MFASRTVAGSAPRRCRASQARVPSGARARRLRTGEVRARGVQAEGLKKKGNTNAIRWVLPECCHGSPGRRPGGRTSKATACIENSLPSAWFHPLLRRLWITRPKEKAPALSITSACSGGVQAGGLRKKKGNTDTQVSPWSVQISQLPTPGGEGGVARADPVHRDQPPTRTKGGLDQPTDHYARGRNCIHPRRRLTLDHGQSMVRHLRYPSTHTWIGCGEAGRWLKGENQRPHHLPDEEGWRNGTRATSSAPRQLPLRNFAGHT